MTRNAMPANIKDRRKRRAREYVTLFKANCPCIECGEVNTSKLEFHHVRDKVIDVSEAAYRGWSLRSIMKETRKCVVLCMKCHRRLHKRAE